MQQHVRVGVDIGGTFTDFVVEGDGLHFVFKLLTTPERPEQAVLAGLDRIVATLGSAAGIGAIVHGTTLATNAVIERRGAKVAFVTTQGFRDTLEMGYEYRFDQYDLLLDRTPPLVERRLRFAVPERIVAGGTVARSLDVSAVEALVPVLRAEKIEAIAIGFLHAFSNPVHEELAAKILGEYLPDIPISISADVAPEIREYDRFSTVVVNAYVRPLMQSYLTRMQAGLRERGIGAPMLMIQSHGGLCDVAAACRYPVRLLESGPAGGAIFAAAIAEQLGLAKALLLDVGGTTAKLCFLDGFKPHTAQSMEVGRADRYRAGSGLPLRFPVIELSEIGAGGGSIASVDSLGRLQIGPRSAAALPGPACYNRGGTEPTITDANLLLGRLDPERFADSAIALVGANAETAIRDKVAGPLGVTLDEAACGMLAIMNENMAAAAREHALDADKSLAGRVLIAIGGGSGLHATDVAAALDIDTVIVPSDAGVGAAAGFLRAPHAFERTLTLRQRLSAFAAAECQARIDALIEHTLRDTLASSGLTRAGIATTLSAQIGYVGQGTQHSVSIPPGILREGDAAARIAAAFERVYAAQFGRTMPGNDIEILSWTARSAAGVGDAASAAPKPAEAPRADLHERRVIDPLTHQVHRAAVRLRGELPAGASMRGPALVIDAGTTIVVPAQWSARVVAGGHLHLTRERVLGGEIAA